MRMLPREEESERGRTFSFLLNFCTHARFAGWAAAAAAAPFREVRGPLNPERRLHF